MDSCCLLFVDPAVELGEDGVRNSAYALFHSKIDSRQNCPVKKAFLKSRIQIIRDSQTIPPKNGTFQVIEVQLNADATATQKNPIRIYCSVNDVELVKTLFRRSPEVDVTEELFLSDAFSDISLNLLKLFAISTDYLFKDSGDTLLHYGVRRKNTALIEMLLKHKIDVNRKNKYGLTALHLAFDENHKARERVCFAKMLLEKGADVKAKTEKLTTPLHMAVESGSVEATRLLIQSGAEVNIASNEGRTPLHIAAGLSGKNDPMVKLLLQANADIHLRDAKGATPLLCAVRMSPAVLQLLVEKGADINVQTNDKRTALLEAVQRGWEESADYILSLSPSTDLKGNKKALIAALSKDGAKFEELVKNMLHKGFTISNDDATNPDVFYGVIQKGFIKTFKRLLDAGAQVNQMHKFMNRQLTPLHLAIAHKQETIVRMLLDRGADVNCSRGSGRFKVPGKTPLEDAVELSTPKIVKMILEANPTDRYDQKHLSMAVHTSVNPGCFIEEILRTCGHHHDMVEFLLEEGYDPNFVSKNFRITCMGLILRQEGSVFDLLTKFGARFSYDDLARRKVFRINPLKRFLDCCTPNITAAGQEAVRKLYNSANSVLIYCAGANDLLARHLVKMEVMNPEFNVEDLVTKTEYEKLQLRLFKEECEAEFVKLKENFEGTDVSFCDILTSDVYRLAYFAKNENIVKAMEPSSIERFPIYSSILNGRFGLGVQLREVLDGATRALKSLFSQLAPLPDEVLQMILRYLSNRDLVILPKCMPVKRPSDTDSECVIASS